VKNITVLLLAAIAWPAAPADAQTPLAGSVIHQKKISETEGGFTGVLSPGPDPYTDPGDLFGISVVTIGDLDGDGVEDLVIGAYGDDDGGFLSGAIWVCFMNADQTVKTQQKISRTKGGFVGPIHTGDLFGWSLGFLGDLNFDGAPEIAVGCWLDDDGFTDAGAIWILSLNPNGTVKHEQKISATVGGFTGTLHDGERFGTSLVGLGDLDGDGVPDLAAGSVYDSESGYLAGAEWILFLNPDGTVRSHQKINNQHGNFSGDILPGSRFSYSACSLGDVDGDGVVDLAIGAITDYPTFENPGPAVPCIHECGAVWILFMRTDGMVKRQQKISQQHGNFTGVFADGENFAHGVASPGDLDGDGVPDLLVGAVGDAGDVGGGPATGTVWVLFLNKDGTVKRHRKINSVSGGFTGTLETGDFFGQSMAPLGDKNGDGVVDVVIGAIGDDDGGADQGAVWILYLYGKSWSDYGGGVAGTHGTPRFAAESSLEGNSSIRLTLDNARENASAFLIASSTLLNKPLFGGTLVPSVYASHFAVAFNTTAQGKLDEKAYWPAGLPADFGIYFQVWVKDPGAPYGFSASNALRGTTP